MINIKYGYKCPSVPMMDRTPDLRNLEYAAVLCYLLQRTIRSERPAGVYAEQRLTEKLKRRKLLVFRNLRGEIK
jgi:hypothetical protein